MSGEGWECRFDHQHLWDEECPDERLDTMSCQPCGCDPEANHMCIIHAEEAMKDTLPALTHKERKDRPVVRGVLDYFPDAILEIAHVSWVGNEQHNPGQPLHWAREKSTDEADCIVRHLIQRGSLDSDGLRHTAKVAWRALALLQRELDHERTGPIIGYKSNISVSPTAFPKSNRGGEEGLSVECPNPSPQGDGDGGSVGTPSQDGPQPPVHPIGHHRVEGHDGALRRDHRPCGTSVAAKGDRGQHSVDMGGLSNTPTKSPTFPSTAKHDSWWEWRGGELVRVG